MTIGTSYSNFNNNLDINDKIINDLELNDLTKQKVLDIVNKIKDDNFSNEYERGKIFETLLKEILEGTKIFKCILNPNTSSNEFDLLVNLNMNGKLARRDRLIPNWIPDMFLIECKNYNKPVKVDYVGKFFSLMLTSKVQLGVFASKIGVTGKRNSKGKLERFWKDSYAFINKVNLKYSELTLEKQIILLDLELEDLELVANDGINIIEILQHRKHQIDTDINASIKEWIKPHQNEGKFHL